MRERERRCACHPEAQAHVAGPGLAALHDRALHPGQRTHCKHDTCNCGPEADSPDEQLCWVELHGSRPPRATGPGPHASHGPETHAFRTSEDQPNQGREAQHYSHAPCDVARGGRGWCCLGQARERSTPRWCHLSGRPACRYQRHGDPFPRRRSRRLTDYRRLRARLVLRQRPVRLFTPYLHFTFRLLRMSVSPVSERGPSALVQSS